MARRLTGALAVLALISAGADSKSASSKDPGADDPNPSAPVTGQAGATQQSGAGQANAAAATEEAYRLGPGDQLKVVVYGDNQITGQYAVDGAGAVSMPLLGEVHVGGLTLRQVEAKLAKSLDAKYLRDPSVTAEVINFRPFYIMGEVMKGGEFPYKDGMSVMNAIAVAGGFTFRAREHGIKIKRAGQTINVHDPAQQTVLPGDVITVPQRFF
jgi:polysaccharide export outer membrane protein